MPESSSRTWAILSSKPRIDATIPDGSKEMGGAGAGGGRAAPRDPIWGQVQRLIVIAIGMSNITIQPKVGPVFRR